MPHKYVIVHFIDIPKVPSVFQYTEWPLHITLLANFTIAQPLELLTSKLEQYANKTVPIKIKANGEALFEPNKKEFGGKAKNQKRVQYTEKVVVIQNSSKKSQLVGPKAKNYKPWEN